MRSQGSPCRSFSKFLFLFLVLILSISLTGCGGSSNRTPNNNTAPVSITISESTVTLATAEAHSFSANVTNATNTSVTWSVQEGAAGGSITATGSYTAPTTAGTYHVVATSQQDRSASANATITVRAVGVTITPDTATLRANGTQAFTASVMNTTNAAVTWSVQEASGGSITSAGVYTAPVVAGTYHVTATSQADQSKSGSATITVTSTPPTFASTPPTDATEGVAYTYALAAQDVDNPNGTVTFEATTIPTGATLEGNVLSWTPTRAQSRVPNTFTVTAVSSEGVRNPQTWSVTPAGTIRVITNYIRITASGKTVIPEDMSGESITVVAKDKDGHQQTLTGAGLMGGFEIPGVPAGYYLFNSGPFGIWTDLSDLDMSSTSFGRSDVVEYPSSATYRHYTFTGLDPWDQDTHWIDWYIPNIRMYDGWSGSDLGAGETSLDDTQQIYDLADANKGDVAIANQTVDENVGGSYYWHIVKSTGPLSVTDTEGSTTQVNAPMVAPANSINLRAKFNLTEFSALMPPNAVTDSATLNGYVHPFDLALGFSDEGADLFYFDLLNGGMSGLSGRSGLVRKKLLAPSATLRPSAEKLSRAAMVPAAINDIDLGALSVANPYPESWKPIYEFSYNFGAPITAPGATEPTTLWGDFTQTTDVAPTLDKPLRPVLGPVTTATIDGLDLFANQTGVSLAPTLIWGPPALGTANAYTLVFEELQAVDDGSGIIETQRGDTGYILFTNATQFTMPEGVLEPGTSYIIRIYAMNQPGEEFNPNLFQGGFPSAEACSFSGVFTTTTAAPPAPLSRAAKPFAANSAFAAGLKQSTFTNQLVQNVLKRLHVSAQKRSRRNEAQNKMGEASSPIVMPSRI